jgi:hypothetical protein
MCPQTPRLSPEYSHKAGLQTVITGTPLQIRPVTRSGHAAARYNGPDHTWASMLDDAARWDDLVTGLRPMSYGAKGVPARCLVSVGPTTSAKASSKEWRLRLRPNTQYTSPRWVTNKTKLKEPLHPNLGRASTTPRPPLMALRQSQLHPQVHLINQLRASHSTLMVVLLSRVVTPRTGPYREVLRKKA